MTRRTIGSTTAAFVVVGTALRLLQYAIPRSLWFDEARNAAEVLKPHWLLMLPPHSAQPTPFGFLCVERAFVAVLGEGEMALRLFPLIAGIAALVAAARLAQLTLRGFAAPFAVSLIALSGPAIYFSAELKQYASDLLAGVLVALWFAYHESRLEASDGAQTSHLPRQAALFGLFGALAVWLSYTSIFYLAAAGVLMIARPLRVRDWRGVGLYGLMGSAWLASFGLHYALSIAHWSQTRWLTAFWADGFPREGELLYWSLSSFVAAFEDPLGVTLAGPAIASLAAVLLAIGVLGATRGNGSVGDRVMILFAGVFGLAFACGLLGVYPFKGRLLLFLVPAMAFLVARGASWLGDLASARGVSPGAKSAVALAGALSLLAGSALSAGKLISLEPLHRHGTVNLARMKGVERGFEGIVEVVRYVARNHRPDDSIYLYYSAEPDYNYYARQIDFAAPTILGVRSQGDYGGYAADLAALRGRARVWLVFSHTLTAERDFMLEYLEGVGTRLDYYRRPRADAYLFDLRTPQRGGKTRADQKKLKR